MLAIACALALVPAGARAGRPPTATPVVPDAAPAERYDPALLPRVGSTYARYHFDFSHAFVRARDVAQPAPVAPVAAERKRLRIRFSNAVDDAVRERIIATLANGDPVRVSELQKLFANDEFLNHAAETIRIFGLHETDLADVTSALVIAGYNASHPVALTAVQNLGLAGDVRGVLLASPLLPALDDATKQTIATEMSYQVLFWEFDATLLGNGQDPATFARLHASIAASLATLGIALSTLRPTETGIEQIAGSSAAR